PLVAAARRGSLDTVRALLRHGADELRPALDEARRWLGRDLAAEVERELAQLVAPEGYESFVRRVREGEGITLVVELLLESGSWSGREQQTGHGAIATLLEHELGLRAPFGELLDRAVPFEDPENENWTEAVAELQRRADEVTYQAAASLTRSPDVWRQVFAVDVLAQLGFGERSLTLLRPLYEEARETPSEAAGAAELLQALILALAHHGDPASAEEVARHARHPQAAVRRRVAFALHTLLPREDPGLSREDPAPAGIEALVELSRDPDTEVRDWSTTGLSHVAADTERIREALAARLYDRDPTVAAEAAQGLARRQDPRAVAALAGLLADADPQSYAYATAREAIGLIQDERARRRLQGTAPRG
ncbi:HEAT repeat domain-containing protein, partial [Streptomyces sp. T-3]|nr:HEAT repeat domain-containing protein [Streptomyces sp. T-3]